jgi:lipopolysaccharide export system protein LptA
MNPLRAVLSCLLLSLAAPGSVRAGAAPAPQPTEIRADKLDLWTVAGETHGLLTGSVTVTGTNLRIVCDRLEIIAEGIDGPGADLPSTDRFKYLLATGNVRIFQGQREANAGRVEIFPRQGQVLLTEGPVVTDRDTGVTTFGSRLELRRGERRIIGEDIRILAPEVSDLGFEDLGPTTPAPAAAPQQ